MTYKLLEKTFVWLLITIFAGIVIHTPVTLWLGVQFPDAALLIKSWKEILMIAMIPLAIAVVTRRKLWGELCADWIFRLIIAYTALHLVLAFALFDGVAVTLAGLAIDLRYILFFGLVYVALKILPQYRRTFLVTAVIGAFVVVGFAVLQLFLPVDILAYIGYSKDTIMPYLTVDKNPDFIRYNSTLRGPNPLGAFAGIVLALLVTLAVKGGVQWKTKKACIAGASLGIFAVIALWISYSRSALVAGMGAVGIVLLVTVARKMPRAVWITGSILLFAGIGALIAARDTTFVSNVLLHENPTGGSERSSNDEHVQSLQTGIERMLAQPLGGGIGSTGSASLHGDSPIIIENQYLFVAHETGWLGLILFLAIFALIMVRLWRDRQQWLSVGLFASGMSLAAIGLLLPVWTDDTVSIVWWGLAAVALAGGKYGSRQQTK